MSLQEKYAKLVSYAQSAGISNLQVAEQNNVLYVNGSASSSVKDAIWAIYTEIDPDMRAGDLVLNIQVVGGEVYEVQQNDNLSKIATKYPGMTWQKIYEANKDVIKNPDVVHPGTKLKIPV